MAFPWCPARRLSALPPPRTLVAAAAEFSGSAHPETHAARTLGPRASPAGLPATEVLGAGRLSGRCRPGLCGVSAWPLLTHLGWRGQWLHVIFLPLGLPRARSQA